MRFFSAPLVAVGVLVGIAGSASAASGVYFPTLADIARTEKAASQITNAEARAEANRLLEQARSELNDENTNWTLMHNNLEKVEKLLRSPSL